MKTVVAHAIHPMAKWDQGWDRTQPSTKAPVRERWFYPQMAKPEIPTNSCSQEIHDPPCQMQQSDPTKQAIHVYHSMSLKNVVHNESCRCAVKQLKLDGRTSENWNLDSPSAECELFFSSERRIYGVIQNTRIMWINSNESTVLGSLLWQCLWNIHWGFLLLFLCVNQCQLYAT